jgi:hypothetical protein
MATASVNSSGPAVPVPLTRQQLATAKQSVIRKKALYELFSNVWLSVSVLLTGMVVSLLVQTHLVFGVFIFAGSLLAVCAVYLRVEFNTARFRAFDTIRPEHRADARRLLKQLPNSKEFLNALRVQKRELVVAEFRQVLEYAEPDHDFFL